MPPTPPYFQLPMTPAVPKPSSASHPTPNTTTTADQRPLPQPARKPLLRLQLHDLSSPGAASFLSLLALPSCLDECIAGVLQHLYSTSTSTTPASHIPPTRSVSLVLRSMPGVAFTRSLDLDADHKEIHLSTDYVSHIPESRRRDELLGVLRHEMVHCWQWNACGSAPGGLVEGIADWVRLRSGFVPPHWKREADGDWDAGYQHTGYFLEYLEERFGEGTVRGINEGLREGKYEEEAFWGRRFGCGVKELWAEYGKSLKRREDKEGGEEKEGGQDKEGGNEKDEYTKGKGEEKEGTKKEDRATQEAEKQDESSQ
ncbi:hypothetical protein W97_08501 [Coniosporium apollinis CBS 100218]|uniref:BSP-domain-containing protein n=1 Tax=Coniosporium apollinis (strain CBS 100218) TaxID=1168221 RepID=R7Z5P8_CONA1|nr:uncharacterized protein W97_08501 [Coniosporium apollinis CBS 100218]EON69241.1 hypothetical protein W97_08501 [Coniosporium apollinis CBS 100218]